MKLNKNSKLHIACDGSAASGKTTGAKLIAKKYNLKFLSSGLLYRYAAYQILKNNNYKISFLKSKFKTLNLNKLNKLNLQTQEISNFSSVIAKKLAIRKILKKFHLKDASNEFNSIKGHSDEYALSLLDKYCIGHINNINISNYL